MAKIRHQPLTIDTRFKRDGVEDSYVYGQFKVERPDGYIDVYESQTGGLFTVAKKYCQQKVSGPRGGKKWVAYE